MQSKIVGKTYSLYGDEETTDNFYKEVDELVELILADYASPKDLLNDILAADKKVKRAKSFLPAAELKLSKYLLNVEQHLKALPIHHKFGSVLSKKKFQYLLSMLEINLTNRINKSEFFKAEKKIALLPHCLRDLSKTCKSEVEGLDYVCKKCSKECYLNKVSALLSDHNIQPFIWKEASKGLLFNSKRQNVESLGVLGIACIPELANGMRLCARKSIPAIGIPLDANRCARWMGDFYDNSVNLSQLEKLLGQN
ncbi:MAG: DUF116 domain-containing protein [Bacteroidetes bacterium]|nr:DUF116 domain-containing protein [Bacteroidota bacterium]